MISPSTGVRTGMAASAIVVGILGTWLLFSEIARPSLPYFPADRASLDTMNSRHSEAKIATSIALLRGDVQTEYLLSLAADLIGTSGQTTAASRESVEQMFAADESAVTLAPYDPRGWLVLALLRSSTRSAQAEIGSALKTSYYTGLNDTDLIPLRLRVMTQAADMADAELQSMLIGDIRSIVMRIPSLRDTLADIYRAASPEAKDMIEANVTGLDRNFLATLRKGG
jgi:hypothetical protein